ncbi:hypothetical protein AB205_0156240 [Aquarana catesbeiana]|uniref:C-type lectin domain-containing protein n=1 Tax=Aquarana catesbeiana TaxID=8400 RepID=A0A2G9RHL3_AQUCT|nr:hypothetical protein AB205_0156240 [Aquarana catesbeiana]
MEAPPDVRCMEGWYLIEGKCYFFSNHRDTWNNSKNFCKSHNSSLAIIDNEKEKTFLSLQGSNYWIGLSRAQDNSGWVWTDGTPYSETLFNIFRHPTISSESEHVYLDSECFKSANGKQPMKCICKV